MVAAVSTTLNPKTVAQSQRVPHSQNPMRPPLLPSDPDNGAAARRPKSREVTSRYLSSSTSTSSASVLRRCPSPSVSGTSTSATVLTPMPSFRRSESVERTHRGTPQPNSLDFGFGHGNGRGEMSAAQKLLFNSTRSLSVSFQGESFPLQVSKAKPAPTPGIRKGISEQRKTNTPTRGTGGGDQTENMKPVDQQRWQGNQWQANCMSRSLDCTDERKKVAGGSGSVVRALQNSFAEDRSSFDGRLSTDSGNVQLEKAVEPLPEGTSASSLDISSDSESVSCSSNSGTQEGGTGKGQRGPRVVVVPARVWQETNNRLRRQPEPGFPSSKNIGAKTSVPSKVNIPKKHSIDSPASSPRQVANNNMEQSSPIRVPVGLASPSKLLASSISISSPSKGSPSRVRCSVTNGFGNKWSSTPSSLSFANDVRKGKMGDSRMVDAHSLKMLNNRLLQWRFVNARVDIISSVQSLNAERNLFSAWNGISELRESVIAKRHELQLLQHKLKLASILESQMTCLDELDLLDQDFSSSLSGITDALEARTLRLPVDEGAKAEVQDVKDAICSAVDVMQAMAPSLNLWLPKVGDVNSVVSKLADVNAHERALLDQCNDLLSTVASMQVKEFSLRTHMLQLERIPA
ncbi:QWRF motif-containing protein 2-like [Benincasa hispida]|uniref:QWRF motif-containing protein 2-like n=1 Tax=Benincasa hispida TaxID=102211 RepID=UPI001901FD03|nr:QWRF motif-containing protein 2-like [Benincasa hispida]